MSKLVQRIVALVVMLAVVMSATAYGASTFVVDYQELKSDAPVVMTVNGEEIHADEYASYMMSQIINYQQVTVIDVFKYIRSALTWTTTITTSMSAHAHRC